MKKSDWMYIAKAMWEYSEKHEGRVSQLLKQLVIEVNKNKEMIIDDMGKYEQDARSNRPVDTDTTSSED
jgi:nucleoid DNA-binding protein|tara:strand:- start:30288 stop:30494 length:207 start_codon:yes stop_codon:yes gene_type:complete